MAKLMTWRVWLVVVVLAMALLAIKPTLNAQGIFIKSVAADSELAQQGMKTGERLLTINDYDINTLEDFNYALKGLEAKTQVITVETDKASRTYNITDSLGFSVNENLTVTESQQLSPIEPGEKILSLQNNVVTNSTEFKDVANKILPKKKISVTTNKGQYVYLGAGAPKITARLATTTNLKKGLDLEGGTRVLLKPVPEEGKEVTAKDLEDIIKVLDNRLNVYGLSDLRIRSSKDWQGNNYILIEIAGISKDEVMDLIGGQGKFEAKIAGKTVFEGGKKDIPFVCRDDGSCSGIRSCSPTDGGYFCKFEFAIHLSPEAAKRHADVTRDIPVIASPDGKEVLSEKLDFYLDGKKVDSLLIGSDLKGRETTAIAISGPGNGLTKVAAVDAATQNMDKLQTILITGSLPMQLTVEKLDSISPMLGKQFLRSSITIGLLAVAAVALVLIIRYRKIKLAFPILFATVSEVTMTLGFAALTGWNLDASAIAGIIAAVGTGVNDQIILLDEMMRGESDSDSGSMKQKIKNAFFIIFAAYATIVAAMLPLWNAGAGMFRGFALTTIVGVTVGVLITRPAYADIVKALQEK